MPKVRITVSIDEKLRAMIDRHAQRIGKNRSRLVEEAIRLWREKQGEEDLKKGYLAMAREDSWTAEANLGASIESIS